MSNESLFVPPRICEFTEKLASATGVQPSAERLTGDRWRISIANSRIEMCVVYRITGKRRNLTWLQSTLKKDGQRIPLAESFDDFVRIFLDPDGERAQAVPPLNELGVDEPLPPGMQRIQESVQAILTSERQGVGLRLGRDGDRWAVGLEMAESRSVVRFYFIDGDDGFVLDKNDPLLLVIAGKDVTTLFRDELLKDPRKVMAVCLMATVRGEFPEERSVTPPPVAKAAPSGKGYGSVDVRRSTVRRV